jgi:hypothetical protein
MKLKHSGTKSWTLQSCATIQQKYDGIIGLAYQGRDIVFTFIIEYSRLRDFYRPLGNNNRSIFVWGFLKDDILACVETWD